MILTDKLNRGLNLSNVKRIINWSPPYSLADYLNRCGRIGRLNQNHIGSVYTFVCETTDGVQRLQKLEEAVRRHVKISQVEPNFNFDQHFKLNRYKNHEKR